MNLKPTTTNEFNLSIINSFMESWGSLKLAWLQQGVGCSSVVISQFVTGILLCASGYCMRYHRGEVFLIPWLFPDKCTCKISQTNWITNIHKLVLIMDSTLPSQPTPPPHSPPTTTHLFTEILASHKWCKWIDTS